MKKKITMVILAAALILLAACGKNNENENTNPTVTGSEAGSEVASENEKLSDASGTVIAIHTTALCLSTESDAGYDGFIAVGEQAELTGISDKWYAIKYNGKTYYVLAKYMETADAEAGTVAETEASTAAEQSETISADVQTSEDKNNVPDNTTGNNTSLNKPAGNKNTAQQATQPEGNKNNSTGKNNTGSNTPAPTKAAVWHDPVYDTKQVWVVDKAAWTEEVKAPRQVPIYKDVEYYECTCGYIISTSSKGEWISHVDAHLDKEEACASRIITKKELTGYETQYDISYINHPEEGHFETQTVLVQDGYWE